MDSKRRKQVQTTGDQDAAKPSEPRVILNPLAGPHGIIFRNDEQKERYSLLSKREIKVTRRIDFRLLGRYGLKDKFDEFLRNLNLTDFAHAAVDCFRHLTLEFLSSMNKNYQEVLSFRLENREYKLPIQKVSEILRLPHAAWVTPSELGFDAVDLWRQLTESDEIYNPETAQVSSIKSHNLRVLHRFISYTFNARDERPEAVLKEDLMILWWIVARRKIGGTYWIPDSRRQFCGTYWILDLLCRSSHTSGGSIVCGAFVTMIAKGVGIDLNWVDQTQVVPFTDSDYLTQKDLLDMNVIREGFVTVVGDSGKLEKRVGYVRAVEKPAPYNSRAIGKPPYSSRAIEKPAPYNSSNDDEKPATSSSTSASGASTSSPGPSASDTSTSSLSFENSVAAQFDYLTGRFDSLQRAMTTRVGALETGLSHVQQQINALRQSFDASCSSRD